jgi:putative MATE family efflux protein
VGVTSVIARVIGQDDADAVRRIATDGLFLANAIVVVVAIGGLVSIGPLFGALGASPAMIALIRQYMVPWYVGIGFIVIPMVGNSAIRATGDTKTPSVVMMIAGGVNMLLDPFLIFGLGPFPRLELQGAAIATLIAYSVTFVAAFWILSRREHMIEFSRPRASAVLHSWRRILYIAVPAGLTQALLPVANGVFTRIVSEFGPKAVAAFGVGTRVDALCLIGTHALFAAVAPFVGQNYGAGRPDRIRQALGFASRTSMIYGASFAVVLALLARHVGAVFNDDPIVVTLVTRYLWVVPASYGLVGVLFIVNAMFNAVNQPLKSAFIIVLRMFVFGIPLAWLLSRQWGAVGVFAGYALGNAVMGAVAWLIGRRFVALAEEEAGRAAVGVAQQEPVAEETLSGADVNRGLTQRR